MKLVQDRLPALNELTLAKSVQASLLPAPMKSQLLVENSMKMRTKYLEPKKVKLEPPVEFEVTYYIPEYHPWLKIHPYHPWRPEVEP